MPFFPSSTYSLTLLSNLVMSNKKWNMFVALSEYLSFKIVQLGRIWTLRLELFDICTKGTFFSENLMMLKKICQFTILNFLLKFLKLHFVCFCFAADFQANPTDISSKKGGKIQMRSLRHICLDL